MWAVMSSLILSFFVHVQEARKRWVCSWNKKGYKNDQEEPFLEGKQQQRWWWWSPDWSSTVRQIFDVLPAFPHSLTHSHTPFYLPPTKKKLASLHVQRTDLTASSHCGYKPSSQWVKFSFSLLLSKINLHECLSFARLALELRFSYTKTRI